MGRPYLVGGSVFRRDADFGSTFSTTSKGIGVIFGRRLGRSSRINIGYNWEDLSSRQPLLDSQGQTIVFQSTYQISSLTPFYVFNTVNNPYRPSRGTQVNLSFQIAGGPLGGDTSFLKPVFRFTQYRRAWARNILALHAASKLDEFWRSDFSEKDLEAVLKEELGTDSTIRDLKKLVLIPTFDMRNWAPKYFDNFPGDDSDLDQRLWEVARCTSAASTAWMAASRSSSGRIAPRIVTS